MKYAFRSSLEGLSTDAFRFCVCDGPKSFEIDKTEGYSLAFFFLKMGCFGGYL